MIVLIIIISIFVASVAFVIFTAAALILKIFCFRTRRVRNPSRQDQAPTPLNDVVVVNENASFDPSLKVSVGDIVAATKSFSSDQIIGCRSFGLIYKAELTDGRNLAVKRLGTDAYHDFKQFRSELEILGKLRHRNIVRLLGYCVSGADKVLIYEFFERGSLDICLHDESSPPLSWETRVKVVKGVANGLAYLHELEKPIIHRNVQPKTILLGLDFEAHIDDFGLSRSVESSQSHVTTEVDDITGYTPSEYYMDKVATTKGDVYSFGVLMLEVATCKRSVVMPIAKGRGISDWAREMASHNREAQMVDPRGFQGPISRAVLEEVDEYFRIALMCTNRSPMERPRMRDVVEFLRKI